MDFCDLLTYLLEQQVKNDQGGWQLKNTLDYIPFLGSLVTRIFLDSFASCLFSFTLTHFF